MHFKPLLGLGKRIAGSLIGLAGAEETPKKRGAIYVGLSIGLGLILVKYFGLDAETANTLTEAALGHLPGP